MNARGMTLIELMIVVLIISILSAIAVPSYRSYVIRVKRSDAKVALVSGAQAMERCFTRGPQIAGGGPPTYLGCAGAYPLTTVDGTYQVTVSNLTRNKFTLTATPLAGQLDDTDCANFTINELGTQAVSGPKGAAACW
jgi:type IV pilus assembly protein PilE